MSASTATESESESHRRPYETVATPDQVPLYDLVSVRGPEGEPLGEYRGVRRRDTSAVVSVVSRRYQLVQHREVAEAVHAIGEALERPSAEATAPAFPREQTRLSAGGRRMEVRLVVGTRYELGRGRAGRVWASRQLVFTAGNAPHQAEDSMSTGTVHIM